ncbi:MAG: rRNA maturation RNase YbeY, partial [Verrucomicrobiia bacterium]
LNPQAMAPLNQRYLNHRGATDVITFQHGEIYICPAIAKQQSQQRNLPFAKELLLYAIHGWLHLLGFNDKTNAQAKRMEQHQQKLLEQLYSSS